MHKSWPKTLWAGNQGNHQNFDPSLLTKNLWLLFMGLRKNILKWSAQKKTYVFQNRQFSIFFAKLIGFGPWVSRINFWKGNQCDSTHMVVRLSDIRPKTGITSINKMWKFSLIIVQNLTNFWTPNVKPHNRTYRVKARFLSHLLLTIVYYYDKHRVNNFREM